ncbi:Ger(x)C family spore germination protein [Bacillus sp. AFS017336]|uniref:Ger(x)C family spore germination protein n=1 Tax=Bacillus sp. AFS017336 TaxID=2033489 RepID=UPI000BF12F05|nr:Ger(x)C family spore germination protein [Bacillus sp. AFS017336]PEK98574.1 hypothetical protein CN601_25235 [Bacillus sp. AFS017336]
MKGLFTFVPILLAFTIFFNNTDRVEINEIGSIISLAIDKQNDQYHLTAQLANAGAKNANSKSMLSPITTFDGTGKTLSMALNSISDKMPKDFDLSHLQLVLISEDLLKKEGIGPTIDFLMRTKKTSTHYPLAVVKNSNPEDLLKVFTPIQDFPSLDIRNMILNISEKNALNVFTSPTNILIELYKKGQDLYLPALQVSGEIKEGGKIENTQSLDPSTTITLNGFAVFHNDKYVNNLSISEGFLYFITQGKTKSTIIDTLCSDGKKAVLKIDSIKANKKLLKSKKPAFELKINIDGTLIENNCNYISPSNFKKNEKELENKFKQELTTNLKKLIQKSKDYDSDFIGFGNTYYIQHPKKWEKIQTNFLKDVEVKPIVSVNIREIATINFNSKFPGKAGTKNESTPKNK